MRVIDVGRFALTLYDKYTGEGVRVYLDPDKLERYPVIKAWFFKSKPKQEQNRKRLLEEVREAGPDICGIHRVQVSLDAVAKKHKKSIAVCPLCHEAYRGEDGAICPACKSAVLPFKVVSAITEKHA
jgi:formylmethanofuran dehydrogenase subunit E